MPVVVPTAPPDSHVRTGEALNASKREAAPKMSVPTGWAYPPSLEGPQQMTGLLGRTCTRGNALSLPLLMAVRLGSLLFATREQLQQRRVIGLARPAKSR